MEILSCLAFWITAVFLVLFSLLTVFVPKISYSVFFGFLSFLMFALLYFLLNAPFNAAVQIAIYGVTISVLFVIAIMMTNQAVESRRYLFISPRLLLTLTGIVLIAVSLAGIIKQDMYFGLNEFLYAKTGILPELSNSINILAETLFTKYFWAFELVSVFMLTGIVGIVVLINKNEKSKEGQNE